MKLQPETYQRVRRHRDPHVVAFDAAAGTLPDSRRGGQNHRRGDRYGPLRSRSARLGESGFRPQWHRPHIFESGSACDGQSRSGAEGCASRVAYCDSAVQHERDLECVRRGVRRTAPGWWNRARHACARCRRWTRGFRVERSPRQESCGPSQRIPCGCPVERLVARPLCAGGGGHRGRGCILRDAAYLSTSRTNDMRPGPAVLFSTVLLTGLTLGVSVWSQTTRWARCRTGRRETRSGSRICKACGRPSTPLHGTSRTIPLSDSLDCLRTSPCLPARASSRATRSRISRGRSKKQKNYENRPRRP